MDKQFKVVQASFASAFEEEVQKYLNDGWELAGPTFGERGHLYVPMTREGGIEGEETIDTSDTMQHPDAKKLGEKHD